MFEREELCVKCYIQVKYKISELQILQLFHIVNRREAMPCSSPAEVRAGMVKGNQHGPTACLSKASWHSNAWCKRYTSSSTSLLDEQAAAVLEP